MKKPVFSPLVVITCVFAAFLAGLFLGRILYRGDVIVSVPSTQVAASGTESISPSATTAGAVNINTASVYELASLPGIGEVLAQRIVAYRDVNGPFSAPEDLLNVSGIGTSKLETILDSVTTGG